MELRNLIDKILLSGADLISLSAGRRGKVDWGGGGSTAHVISYHFLSISKRCRVTIRTLQLLLNNVKRLSVNSSKVIHRKDRERYIIKKISERCDEERNKYFLEKGINLRGHFDSSKTVFCPNLE
jgi:hypothetical protein